VLIGFHLRKTKIMKHLSLLKNITFPNKNMKYSIKNQKVVYNPALNEIDTSKVFVEQVRLMKETLDRIGVPNVEKLAKELKEKGLL
jgi:hypothetical protein